MKKQIRDCASHMWEAWQQGDENRDIEDDMEEWEDIMRDCRVWYKAEDEIESEMPLHDTVRQTFIDRINNQLAFREKSRFIETCEEYLTTRPIIGD